MIGYFGLITNRMTMYDLTAASGRGNRLRTQRPRSTRSFRPPTP